LQVFGGYSWARADTEGVTGATLDSFLGEPSGTFHNLKSNYSGWEAAAQYRIWKGLGAVGDLTGHYGKPLTANGLKGFPIVSSYSYLFGPVMTFHSSGRLKPFVHLLAGRDHLTSGAFTAITVSNNILDTAWAGAAGGGIDYKLKKHRLEWRVVQVDYFHTRHNVDNILESLVGGNLGLHGYQNNIRAATGVVYRFGK
jgi:hypothetical protein